MINENRIPPSFAHLFMAVLCFSHGVSLGKSSDEPGAPIFGSFLHSTKHSCETPASIQHCSRGDLPKYSSIHECIR